VGRSAILILVWGSVAAAAAGFFLPWAAVDLRAPQRAGEVKGSEPVRDVVQRLTQKLGRVEVSVRRGTETISGELPSIADLPQQVSGVQIPQLANEQKAQVALALIELLTNTRQRIGLKSYVVYLVPGIALLCGMLLTLLSGRPAAAGAVGLLCAGIAGAGFWKVMTTHTQTIFATITFGCGIWLSLWAYVALAVSAALCLTLRRREQTSCGHG